ncbi:MAG: hypothetical protein NTY48_00945 [Candidatus Diapherotrites archaeon]|nr:hypothetical protein [Candidatus Diapherotrites archaeon]
MVSKALRNKAEISFGNINYFQQQIKIESGKIITDFNTQIDAKNTIRAMIKEKAFELRADENKIILEDDNVSARIDKKERIKLDNNGLISFLL